jgi:hypothetical protein
MYTETFENRTHLEPKFAYELESCSVNTGNIIQIVHGTEGRK